MPPKKPLTPAERARERASRARARIKGLSQRLRETGVVGRGGQKLSPDRPFNRIQNQVNALNRDLRGISKQDLKTPGGRQRVRAKLKEIPKVQKLAEKVPDRFRFDNMRPGFLPPAPGTRRRRPAGTLGNILGSERAAGMASNTGKQLKIQAQALRRIGDRLFRLLKRLPVPGLAIEAPKVSPERLRERTARRAAML